MSRTPRAATRRTPVELLEARVFFAAGDLDRTFSGDGVASFDLRYADGGAAVVAQPDGKVVVAGGTSDANGGNDDFLLVRFNVDGTLDRSFGTGGYVTTDRGDREYASSVAMLPDGGIFAAGPSWRDSDGRVRWAVARYTRDGSPDARFSADGMDLLDLTGTPNAVRAQPDGKVLVVGDDWNVLRYTAAGMLDPTFGERGVVKTLFHDAPARAMAVDLAPDGRIVVAGSFSRGGGVVARYLPDGRLDTSYSKDGRSFVDDLRVIVGVAVQPDNRIVVADMDYTLLRLNAGGGYDIRFGGNGIAHVDVAAPLEDDNTRNMVRQPDGKFLVCGFTANHHPGTENVDSIMVRFTADGRPDPAFGGNGVVRVPGGSTDYGEFDSIGLAPDGKIVASGDHIHPGRGGPDVFPYQRELLAYRFENDLVAPPPPPPSGVFVEAEEPRGGQDGWVLSDDHPGFTGEGFIDFVANTGGHITWNLNDVPGPGNYVIDFRYANGSSSARTLGFEAFPGNDKTVSFPPTGSWNTWRTLSVPVTLGGGGNAFSVTMVTTGQNGPNIDSLTTRKVDQPPPQQRLEAERARLVGARAASGNGGYTGTGYADYANASGDFIEWTFDHAVGGDRTLTFRYANGSSSDRPLELRVNGQVVNPRLSFAPMGSWTTWREVTVSPVVLAIGENRVRLTSVGSNGPNVDWVLVQ